MHSMEPGASGLIYLVGLGWMRTGVWEHRSLVATGLSAEAETSLVTELLTLVRELAGTHPRDTVLKFYHYSHADQTLLRKAFDRAQLPSELSDTAQRLTFCDLYRLVREEPVLVRGALDFSLKSLVRALRVPGTRHGRLR